MELSKKFTKRHYLNSAIVYFLTYCMLFNTSLPIALAGPEGAQVVNGQVSFQQSGYNTTITASDKSIINYSGFDIARPEIVQFIQPGSSASVLNRILSANPTNINGMLLANGRVFFVNPAGVYIGAGARINVNQLVASGLNITNSDFINGQYNFVGGDGAVINSGDIAAEKVYLIGRQVANSGSISCPAGYVVMASGDRVFLGEPGTDVMLEVDAPSLPGPADPVEGSGVLNEGTVDAAGGKIVLAAGDIYSQAISNTGSLSASVETGEAGQIKLTANGGQVTNTGTIEASGDNGGSITIDGGNVTLTADSVIHADATGAGDGGEVLIYADNLDLDGVVTAAGIDGYILFDPEDTLDIDQTAADAIEVSLIDTETVDVAANVTINLNGEIDSSIQTNDHTLNFKDDNANNDLTINLNNKIILGDNQTLTGDGTTINVASTGLIQNGIDVAATGATVTVDDGSYTEDLIINKDNLTLQSVNGRNNTTIQLVDGVGINIGSGGNGFTLGGDVDADPDNGVDNGFEINSGGATTFNIQLTNGPSDVEISWNELDTTGSASMGINIGAGGATRLNINNNTFTAEGGDGSIWGEVFGSDTTVSNNTFTGPGGLVSGYAIQFKAATGASTITGNNITGYGWGVGVLTGGGGTSGLTISGNSISNCIRGIGLAQYQTGDITTVDITGNTLSNNTTGIRIYDGAGVKASNFTIENNSFSGNTTALANQHTSESITATQNYWGSANGPTIASNTFNVGSQGDAITEAVAGSVTYTPWLDGVGGSLFAPVENLMSGDLYASIQAGVDDASSDDDLRAEAGTYSEDVHADDSIDVDFKVGSSVIDGTLTTEADCQITSSGSLRITGTVEAASNITTSSNLTFDDVVIADGGASQTFDAEAGTLTAKGISKAAGDLTLGGATGINISGDLSAVGLTLEDDVTATGAGSQEFDAEAGTLTAKGISKAAGDLTLGGATGIDISGDLSAVGLTLEDVVTATGAGSQEFDAEAGTLLASSTITKTGGTDLTLQGALVDLDGSVNVQGGSLILDDNTIVAAGETLKASGDVILADGKTLTGTDSLIIEATGGGIQAAGAGSTISVTGSLLTLTQDDNLDFAKFTFALQNTTNLIVDTGGWFKALDAANGGKNDNAADQWNSITATAENNIELQGTGDIKIGGALTSTSGGVSIISDTGKIYTPGGANDTLNVAITGSSDGTTGVPLPAGSGKAAIVIWSKLKDLKLGSSATLTANGTYDDSVVDDRASVNFLPPPPLIDEAGEPIDIAIYLGSFNHILPPPPPPPLIVAGGNVTVDSTVSMAANGTMAIDAYDTVNAFGSNFTASAPWSDITNRLEVVSRKSPTLDYAAEYNTLPHADEARSDMAPPWFGGKTYILRGKDTVLAEVLAKIEPVPLVLPKPLEPEDQGQVQIERRDAEVLGLGDKPELARAYPPSLNTDLNLDKAAQKLYALVPILKDSDRIATLNKIVVELWQDAEQPIAPEQEAVIAQRIGGSTAGPWVAALMEYADVLRTMVGRSESDAVLYVMRTYVIPLAEQGLIQDQTVAFVEMQIEGLGG